MKKKFFLFAACLLFAPFALFSFGAFESDSSQKNDSQPSMQEQYDSGYWSPGSPNKKLTVIGMSNQMTTREKEIDSAKKDAARKVAMFYGISGSMETINRTGRNFFDYVHDSNFKLNFFTDYESYIDQLSFDPQNDVLETDEGVFIRFQHETTVEDIEHVVKMINKRPSWLNARDMPKISGYITAVGLARKQRRLKDTILRSTENAIARMIEELSTMVATHDITEAGRGSLSTIHTRSEGSLKGFRVIDFWVEPKTGYVYTLAIADSDGG